MDSVAVGGFIHDNKISSGGHSLEWVTFLVTSPSTEFRECRILRKNRIKERKKKLKKKEKVEDKLDNKRDFERKGLTFFA